MRLRRSVASVLALGFVLLAPLRALAQDDLYRHAASFAARPGEKSALDAGALPLDRIFELAAVACFGDEALSKPIKYLALKKGLERGGIGTAELSKLIGNLSPAERDRLLDGKMTPREIFAKEATRRSSWRADTRPMAYDRVKKLLDRDGQLPRLEKALATMPPAERDALRAGQLSPEKVLQAIEHEERKRPDVVIVGAGVSGLRAARLLELAGKKVVILEASAEVGGRVETNTTSFSSGPLDTGGAWIHNFFENVTAGFAKALGLTLVRDVPKPALVFDGGTELTTIDSKRLDAYYEKAHAAALAAKAAGKDVSVADLMVDERDALAERLLANSHHGVTDTKHLSAFDYLLMAEEAEDRLVKEGMGNLPEALKWG
ncbi:MAG: FAD-dependent oxidoreductase, partial [Planctomycetota bacterium]